MRTSVKLFAAATLLLASGSLAYTAGADGDHPGLTPESVDQLILPGSSFDVEKTVHTPEIPPDPEIYFLVDTTGSMGLVIDEAKTEIDAIIADSWVVPQAHRPDRTRRRDSTSSRLR